MVMMVAGDGSSNELFLEFCVGHLLEHRNAYYKIDKLNWLRFRSIHRLLMMMK